MIRISSIFCVLLSISIGGCANEATTAEASTQEVETAGNTLRNLLSANTDLKLVRAFCRTSGWRDPLPTGENEQPNDQQLADRELDGLQPGHVDEARYDPINLEIQTSFHAAPNNDSPPKQKLGGDYSLLDQQTSNSSLTVLCTDWVNEWQELTTALTSSNSVLKDRLEKDKAPENFSNEFADRIESLSLLVKQARACEKCFRTVKNEAGQIVGAIILHEAVARSFEPIRDIDGSLPQQSLAADDSSIKIRGHIVPIWSQDEEVLLANEKTSRASQISLLAMTPRTVATRTVDPCRETLWGPPSESALAVRTALFAAAVQEKQMHKFAGAPKEGRTLFYAPGGSASNKAIFATMGFISWPNDPISYLILSPEDGAAFANKWEQNGLSMYKPMLERHDKSIRDTRWWLNTVAFRLNDAFLTRANRAGALLGMRHGPIAVLFDETPRPSYLSVSNRRNIRLVALLMRAGVPAGRHRATL